MIYMGAGAAFGAGVALSLWGLWMVVWATDNATPQQSRELSNAGVPNEEVHGKVWVVDGDDIRIRGEQIRMGGIDAPEHDQVGTNSNGQIFQHGRAVKNSLLKKIGGQMVRVEITGTDKFSRRVGTVFLNGKDINREMVRHGLAIAAYGDQYKDDQTYAQKKYCGMWGQQVAYDPRYWKHGKYVKLNNPFSKRRKHH